ncbi:MAG: TIGR02391 family protein [SAR202 cluster bacterium]|nr:TIGR02391 family protein [SAR202 cluster bacterium]
MWSWRPPKQCRTRSGCWRGVDADGSALVDRAFGTGTQGNPVIRFNKFDTGGERSEHAAFAQVLRGFLTAFRDIAMHGPTAKWTVEEAEAIEILTLASHLHRRLDRCEKAK